MPFDALPDHARLWLLALEHAPGTAAEAQLHHGLGEIIGPWRHKGQAYQGAFALLQRQIIAVAEPTLAAQPSGCAIDGMLRKIERLAGQLALPLVDPADTVLVRLGAELRAFPKAELDALLADGTLTAATPVLDLALYTVGDLRAGKLETPLHATWIGRKFKIPALQPSAE